MQIVGVKVEILEGCENLPLPVYKSPGAAGMDLYAAFNDPWLMLQPGDIKLVSAGIAIALPEGFEAQIRPRSGLALKKGLSIVNSPGTIDSDYRGPVGVILINHGKDEIIISRGERMAQMVIAPVVRCNWIVQAELDQTERGAGGYGSTGK